MACCSKLAILRGKQADKMLERIAARIDCSRAGAV